jgi:hypothetical protein
MVGILAAGHAASSGSHTGLFLALAVVFVIGMSIGRRRGLKHLSQVEFRNRWSNVKNHRPF